MIQCSLKPSNFVLSLGCLKFYAFKLFFRMLIPCMSFASTYITRMYSLFKDLVYGDYISAIRDWVSIPNCSF
ncbi:hypothetical protein PRUPE_8G092400 [Prunus persica]|uniref:Uncharacterized protein n=1 Tax=Prunus persica TaxID=3760 RepID=A0A251MYJ2_PRUPE|nr:hypothetical protein PRUPE_8G092400 [Prunus persica]